MPKNLQNLLRLFNELGFTLLIHPHSVQEIKNDKNEERRKIVLSKIGSYAKLESPPILIEDDEFVNLVGKAKNTNEAVDNALLYAVYRNAVNFLITEDRKLLSKTYRVDLSGRVLSIDDALEIFRKEKLIDKVRHPPALEAEYCYGLNITDKFFDSFREDYLEFDNWFSRVSAEGRRCWVYRYEDGSIGALLIYKIEDEPVYDVGLPRKRRFKICSFKVVHYRNRLGELFIKLAVEYCIKNKLDEIYLTVFGDKYESLVYLIKQFGFEKIGQNLNGEDVFLKKLVFEDPEIPSNKTMISSKYYPSFYDGYGVSKFLIPIQPQFHERLFTSLERQTTLVEYSGRFIIEGNSIKKAYLCHSKITKISPGDILLFYRSHDQKAVTTLGVVENVRYKMRNVEKILEHVSRRTVYSISEIEEMATKPILVILFNYHFHFRSPIGYEKLKTINAIKGPPMSIVKLSHKAYQKIIDIGGLDGRYIIH